jgi:dynein heavy chain 2
MYVFSLLKSVFQTGQSSIKFEIVHGLLRDAIYGGRIDDPNDLKKMDTFLKQIFSEGESNVI